MARKRLIDALRDPAPAAVRKSRAAASKKRVGTRKKSQAKKAKASRKKAPRPQPKWPDGWIVDTVRCHGVTAKNTQCGRRAKPTNVMCGAHKAHTKASVFKLHKDQALQALEAGVSERHGPDAPASPKGGGGKGHIQDVPEDRKCRKVLYANTAREKRCTLWTITIEDDCFDDYCVNHSKHPRAKLARKKAQEAGKKGLEGRQDYNKAVRQPIFNGELKTQDDVAAARLMLMRKLEVGGGIGATTANVLGGLLKDQSAHIERYGSHEGAEGGAGVLRLMPGMQLIEMDQEIDYVMTKDDLDMIEAGLARDEKAGVPCPAEFDEIVFKYLGKKTRKRDRSRNYED